MKKNSRIQGTLDHLYKNPPKITMSMTLLNHKSFKCFENQFWFYKSFIGYTKAQTWKTPLWRMEKFILKTTPLLFGYIWTMKCWPSTWIMYYHAKKYAYNSFLIQIYNHFSKKKCNKKLWFKKLSISYDYSISLLSLTIISSH